MNFKDVTSWSIPVNGVPSDVRRVSIGGVTIWEKPTPLPYVMDGLIAWYDGIWNAGMGTHDASARTWTNLVSDDHHWALGPKCPSFGADHLVCTNGTAASDATSGGVTDPFANVEQVEVVYRYDGNQWSSVGEAVLLFCGDTANPAKCINAIGVTRVAYFSAVGGRVQAADVLATDAPGSLSVAYGDSGGSLTGWAAWTSGAAAALTRNSSTFGHRNGQAALNGRNQSNNRSFDGRIYSLRVYSRRLTDAEVAANYAADRARFGLTAAAASSTAPTAATTEETE